MTEDLSTPGLDVFPDYQKFGGFISRRDKRDSAGIMGMEAARKELGSLVH